MLELTSSEAAHKTSDRFKEMIAKTGGRQTRTSLDNFTLGILSINVAKVADSAIKMWLCVSSGDFCLPRRRQRCSIIQWPFITSKI